MCYCEHFICFYHVPVFVFVNVSSGLYKPRVCSQHEHNQLLTKRRTAQIKLHKKTTKITFSWKWKWPQNGVSAQESNPLHVNTSPVISLTGARRPQVQTGTQWEEESFNATSQASRWGCMTWHEQHKLFWNHLNDEEMLMEFNCLAVGGWAQKQPSYRVLETKPVMNQMWSLRAAKAGQWDWEQDEGITERLTERLLTQLHMSWARPIYLPDRLQTGYSNTVPS